MVLTDCPKTHLFFSCARPEESFEAPEQYGKIFSLCVPDNYVIEPRKTVEIPTNLRLHFPCKYVAIPFLDENLKKTCILLGPNIVKSGLYELKIRLFNYSENEQLLEKGAFLINLLFLRGEQLEPVQIESRAYTDEID